MAKASVVVGIVLLIMASATTTAAEVSVPGDLAESTVTEVAIDDVDVSTTTQTESVESTTATDYVSDVTSNETLPGDTVTGSYASNFDEATEEPSTTAETDAENGAGWDDGTASNGALPGEEQLAENQEMMRTFYERYNSTTKEVDLVFVLDRSGSVPRKGWQAIVQFVKVRPRNLVLQINTFVKSFTPRLVFTVSTYFNARLATKLLVHSVSIALRFSKCVSEELNVWP